MGAHHPPWGSHSPQKCLFPTCGRSVYLVLPALIAQGLSAWAALPLANGGVSNLIIWPSLVCRQWRGALLAPRTCSGTSVAVPKAGVPCPPEQGAACCCLQGQKAARDRLAPAQGFCFGFPKGRKRFLWTSAALALCLLCLWVNMYRFAHLIERSMSRAGPAQKK